MDVIRKTKSFELNKGDGQARGVYNVSSRLNDDLSNWFDNETKKELMKLKANEFNIMCKELCNNSL